MFRLFIIMEGFGNCNLDSDQDCNFGHIIKAYVSKHISIRLLFTYTVMHIFYNMLHYSLKVKGTNNQISSMIYCVSF